MDEMERGRVVELKSDFIFALDWLHYRLGQCCDIVMTKPPYGKMIVLEEYRIACLSKLTNLILTRFPAIAQRESRFLNDLQALQASLKDYTSDVYQHERHIKMAEKCYKQALLRQKKIDVERRRQSLPVLAPDTCRYVHVNRAEAIGLALRQQFDIAPQRVANVMLVPKQEFTAAYRSNYRVQAGGFWSNQQLIDGIRIGEGSPVLWPVNYYPLRYYDRQYAAHSIVADRMEESGKVADTFIGKVFEVGNIHCEWVHEDTFITQYALPARLPDLPIGRFYIPAITESISMIRTEWDLEKSPFHRIIKIICAITLTPSDIESINSGIFPEFVYEIERETAALPGVDVENLRNSIWSKVPTTETSDLAVAAFRLQELYLAAIFNLVASSPASLSQKQGGRSESDDLESRFLYLCSHEFKVNQAVAAVYGLCAIDKDLPPDTSNADMLKRMQKQLSGADKFRFADTTPDEKSCSKARKILIKLGAQFDSPRDRRAKHGNKCLSIPKELKELLYRFIFRGDTRE